MKRRNFMKIAGLLSTAPAFSIQSVWPGPGESKKKEIYEWRIYSLTKDSDLLDHFFSSVLIPAYNRKDVRVGVFKPFKKNEEENDTRHLLFVYPDIENYIKIQKEVWEDGKFIQDSKKFYELTAESPVFSNFETYLSEAFDKIPSHRKPGSDRSLFEIRIYQSPNEEANKRKVKMFNSGEIDIFDETGIHSVFYGDILAGPCMPSLMYLTWYKDEISYANAWDKFRNHPDWISMKNLPEYANTATNNLKILLTPLDFSQF